MLKDMLLGVIRHVLTTAGGAILVAPGFVDDAGLQAIVGGVVVLLGVAWSAAAKRGVPLPLAAPVADGGNTDTTPARSRDDRKGLWG